MPVKVTVDHPNIGEGVEIYIHGLGTFKNGTDTIVSDEQIARYQATHSVVDTEVDEETRALIPKPRLGLHPADQEIYGVRIVRGKITSSGEEGTQ